MPAKPAPPSKPSALSISQKTDWGARSIWSRLLSSLILQPLPMRRMPMSLTRDLGRFVANVAFPRLPAEAIEVARIGFIDCIATMIAGARDPAPQLLRRALQPTSGDATLYFSE